MSASRIDAHQHFWRYQEDEYPWIDGSMDVLKRDFEPADLMGEMEPAGFTMSVAVQARHSLQETNDLLVRASEYPSVRGVVGWVDLCSPAVHDDLARLSENPALCGVRHQVQDEPDDRFLLREDFLRGIEAVGHAELAYDLLVFPRHMPVVFELLKRFPDQRFVLDHLAKPPIQAGEHEPWSSELERLASYENLYCKISGLVTEADWADWRISDFRPYLDRALEVFGSGRLMFGSDWPVCTLAGSYANVTDLVKEWASELTDAERGRIFGANAVRFYRLPE